MEKRTEVAGERLRLDLRERDRIIRDPAPRGRLLFSLTAGFLAVPLTWLWLKDWFSGWGYLAGVPACFVAMVFTFGIAVRFPWVAYLLLAAGVVGGVMKVFLR